MIIAIDGPAASGKGTLAKRLAAHYGYHHLDTGVIYRAVAHALIGQGASLEDKAAAVDAAKGLDPAIFDNPALKSHQVGTAASVVSAIPRCGQCWSSSSADSQAPRPAPFSTAGISAP